MNDNQHEVIVVRHGTRRTTRSQVFLNFDLYGEPDDPHTVDYYFWVVRGAGETILVDTGFTAAAAARRGRTILVDVETAYRELGIDPETPVQIVVTHAHYDHIGNLQLFPNATIVIAQSELDFWASELSTRIQIAHFTEHDEVRALLRLRDEGRVRTFAGSLEIAPGVNIIEVGGHTPGQSMVTVATADGVVLIASDVVHFREELEREMPFISVTDLVGMYEGFSMVKRMLADGQISLLVPGHDADVLDTTYPYGFRATSPLHGLVGSVGGAHR